MKNIIIILGSPNSSKGRLSKIAIGRAKKCLEIFNPAKDMILCTGGFGLHFNISKQPHADHLKRYLINNGILENCILPFANSSNTVEDATKAKEILLIYEAKEATIITTIYHLKRVQLIFDEILAGIEKKYFGVPNNMSEKSILKFEKHEINAIEGILRDGLYY
ncbi:MAG: YdcF family protein [Arcicella sp.]|nr:YdcF family protein [Arcicella sp.]